MCEGGICSDKEMGGDRPFGTAYDVRAVWSPATDGPEYDTAPDGFSALDGKRSG